MGSSAQQSPADPTRYGLTQNDIVRYGNAIQTNKGLIHDAGPNGLNHTYLMDYDPTAFGGKGRALVAIGNPDTARNTSVIVPGTSSSVTVRAAQARSRRGEELVICRDGGLVLPHIETKRDCATPSNSPPGWPSTTQITRSPDRPGELI